MEHQQGGRTIYPRPPKIRKSTALSLLIDCVSSSHLKSSQRINRVGFHLCSASGLYSVSYAPQNIYNGIGLDHPELCR